MNRIRQPSPALIVAVLALVAALAGTAIAGPDVTTSAVSKKKVKKIATKQINKLAPGLSVAHANTAGMAETAANADALDGAPANSFLRSRRILYGRARASGDRTLLLSWPAMGLEVRTHDTTAGDDSWEVRIRNTNPPGGTKLYVSTPGTATPIAPGASSAVGGLTGLPNALVVESGGSGRLVELGCFANVIAPGDDNFVQCMAVTAGPGS